MVFLSHPNKKSLPELAALEGFNAQIIPYSGQLYIPLYNDNNAHQRSLDGRRQYPPAVNRCTDLNIVSHSTHSQNHRKNRQLTNPIINNTRPMSSPSLKNL
jgi:hypothetical protein